MSVPSLRTRSRYTEKFPNAKTDLRPRVWRQLSAVLFIGEKVTVFLVLVLQAPFLGIPAMAKSTDDIARSLNVSDLDPLRTPSMITSRTAASAIATRTEFALLARASWKQGHSKRV